MLDEPVDSFNKRNYSEQKSKEVDLTTAKDIVDKINQQAMITEKPLWEKVAHDIKYYGAAGLEVFKGTVNVYNGPGSDYKLVSKVKEGNVLEVKEIHQSRNSNSKFAKICSINENFDPVDVGWISLASSNLILL